MTNPSETATKLRNLAKWLDRENDESTGNIAREAADTIDRLTSSGEAGVTAEIMGTIIPYLAPAVSISEVREKLAAVLASPREGHVEVPVDVNTDAEWELEQRAFDASDLDMIRRGDMLGPKLGAKVFAALQSKKPE